MGRRFVNLRIRGKGFEVEFPEGYPVEMEKVVELLERVIKRVEKKRKKPFLEDLKDVLGILALEFVLSKKALESLKDEGIQER